MDAGISRASIPERADPHDWNTWDHYRTIHEIRLAQHPFVDHASPNTLEFEMNENEGVLLLRGHIYCLRNVVLEVEKWLDLRYFGTQLKVRGSSYRYSTWVYGGGRVLRYHNVHSGDSDYHHRVFDPATDQQTLYERLERYQFPTLSEVLDEAELLTRTIER